MTKMYPAGAPPDKELADRWTWDFFSQAAEKCHKAGYPFGMPLGTASDSVNWVGAVFASHGAQLVDEEGNITVKSDATKQVLEWFKKLVPFFPPSVFAWDDASQQQVADLGQGRADHEPALGLGGGGARCAEGRRAVLDLPAAERSEGPLRPGGAAFWGIWKFSPNKSAAKSLLTYLSSAPSVEQLVAGEPRLRHPAL